MAQVSLWGEPDEPPRGGDETMPEVLRRIAGLVGTEAALKLVGARGGIRLYVPAAPRPQSTLAQIVGIEAASKLAGEFGGLTLVVPRAAACLRAERNRRIREEKAKGRSAAEIAREFQVTERLVWMVLGETDG